MKIRESLFMFTPFLLLLLSGSVILPGLRLWQRLDIELIQSRERLSLIKSYQLITKESPSSNPAFLNGLKRSNITDVFVSIQRLAGNSGVKIESMKPGEAAKVKVSSLKYIAVPLELRIYGQEASLMRFISGLEKSEFLSRINIVSVTPDIRNDGMVRGFIRLEKIDLV